MATVLRNQTPILIRLREKLKLRMYSSLKTVRRISQNYQMKSAGIMTLMLDPLCDWLPELYRLQPQLYFIQLQHQFQLLLLCSDTSKNMIKIILPFFVNKCQFL